MRLLTLIPSVSLFNWSVGFALDNRIAYNPAYPLRPIGTFLTRVREEMTVQDGETYQRVTVRTLGKGVLQRDTAVGRAIGTKRQFRVRPGQFILSRIDARHGAMGLVPPELDGAIVTNDFPTYRLDEALIHPRFFVLVTGTPAFTRFCQQCSTGTTNRQRLDEDQFLNVAIPLPPPEEQDRLVEAYEARMAAAAGKRAEAAQSYGALDRYLLTRLGIQMTEQAAAQSKWHFINSDTLGRWDTQYFLGTARLAFTVPPVKLRQVVERFMTSVDGTPFRVDPQAAPEAAFHYVGLENVEKNTGKLLDLPVVKGEDIKSSCLRVPPGYVAYNKLRPYLNKFWHNDTAFTDIISTPELFIFQVSEALNLRFFLAVLGSSVVQHQIKDIMSGARMPRISELDFFNLDFPLPDATTQAEIASAYTEGEKGVTQLRAAAGELEADARAKFEAAIFLQQ